MKAFQSAVAETAAAITAEPENFRNALPKMLEIEPAVASKMVLPVFKSDIDIESLRFLADWMHRKGYVDDKINVEAITAR